MPDEQNPGGEPALTAMRNQELEWREMRPGSRPGNNYVRIARHRSFRRNGTGHLLPEPEAVGPRSGTARALRTLKRLLVGAPLASEEELAERTGKFKGLAIFA